MISLIDSIFIQGTLNFHDDREIQQRLREKRTGDGKVVQATNSQKGSNSQKDRKFFTDLCNLPPITLFFLFLKPLPPLLISSFRFCCCSVLCNFFLLSLLFLSIPLPFSHTQLIMAKATRGEST